MVAGKGELIEVTLRVHPANVERLKKQAKLWEIDPKAVDSQLWTLAMAVARDDEEAARALLESASLEFSWQRLIDVATSGPEGLQETRDYLGRLYHGVYS